MARRVRDLRADLALVGVTVIWGSTFTVTAEVVRREPPLAYLVARFLLGLAFLVLLALPRRRTPRLLTDSLVMGTLLAAGMACQVVGQTETTASKAAFITGLSVVLTPFFAIARSRRSPGAANLAGVALAAVGFGLLTWPSRGGPINRGDLFVLGCAAAFALYIVENAARAPRHDPIVFTAWQIGVCVAVLAAMSGSLRFLHPALAVTPLECRPLLLDRGFLLAVAYMGTFATVATFVVQTWAQTRMSATHAAIIFALEPVWAAIFAAALLAERLGPRAGAGGALVIAGIVVSELRPGAP